MLQFALIPLIIIVSIAAPTFFVVAPNISDKASLNPRTNNTTNLIPDQTLPVKRTHDLVRDFNPSKGQIDAKVTVVAFLDFQCPSCKSSHPVQEVISQKYKDRVRFVYKMFPLKNIHQNAQSAAQSALAAHKQGKYFEYAEELFLKQDDPGITIKTQEQIAKKLGLNLEQWKKDRESIEIINFIQGDYGDGLNAKIPDLNNPNQMLSVDSTPTYVFIKNGQITYKTNGLSVDEFGQKLDSLLK